VPKRAVMNWFERRLFVRRLVAAGGRATGSLAFDRSRLDRGETPDGYAQGDPLSTLDATVWQIYAVWGPWEQSGL
jgi:hypothetical protein